MDLAIRSFGRSEADGYPQPDISDPATVCHGWQPVHINSVIICSKNNLIVKFYTAFGPLTHARMALPVGLTATFPITFASLGKLLANIHTEGPYGSGSPEGEGYWVLMEGWHYISLDEGAAQARLIIEGQKEWDEGSKPPQGSGCDFAEFSKFAQGTNVTSVSIEALSTTNLIPTCYHPE
jgi:hypothetical protein